jgi:uncharacterized protein (TIGR03437 family)
MRLSVAVLTLLILDSVPLPAADPLTVSTHDITFQAVVNGLMPIVTTKVTVSPPGGAWNFVAGAGPANMLSVSKTGDVLAVTIPAWWVPLQKPGKYKQPITIYATGSDPATGQVIQVTVDIVAASPDPKFSYLNGPNGCSAVPGLLDRPLCIVPGEKPGGNFTPPAAGASYLDPNFGGRVSVLTGPETFHGYSSPSAISPGNKYVLVFDASGSHILDLKTGAVVIKDPGVPNEGAIWDGRSDSVMYSLGGSGRPSSIMKYDLQTRKTTVLADFSKAPYNFKAITSGGTGEGSKDNWLPFSAPAEQQVCAYSVDDNKAYCADLKSVSGGPYTIDFPTMARGVDHATGKRFLVTVGSPSMLVFTVNKNSGRLDLETRGPERISFFTPPGNGNGICDPGEACVGGSHSDLFEDSAGDQYMLIGQELQSPCEASLVSFRLNAGTRMGLPVELGGGMRRIMGMFRCGGQDPWVDLHIGCARFSPHCVVSTTYGGFNQTRDPNNTSAIVRSPFLSEVFVVRDNGAEIRRLAQDRSVQFKNELSGGYWSTPRACISGDGAYVVFDSNFGSSNQRRVVQVATGFGPTRVATVVNAVSWDDHISPGSLATILGQTLAHCDFVANQLPLPETVCGLSVKFGGIPAKVLFAEPQQLNVQVPNGLAAGTDTTLMVSSDSNPEGSDSLTIPAESFQPVSPAIFSYVLDDGTTRAVAQLTDGSLIGPGAAGTKPLPPGATMILWASGLGPTDPKVADGSVPPADTLANTVSPVKAFINQAPQTVIFAGLAPSLVGVYQLNIQSDSAIAPSADQNDLIWLSINGAESPKLNIALAR